jgi:hypothetical protein
MFSNAKGISHHMLQIAEQGLLNKFQILSFSVLRRPQFQLGFAAYSPTDHKDGSSQVNIQAMTNRMPQAQYGLHATQVS